MVIKKWNGSAWVATYPDVQVSNIEASGTPSSSTFLRGDGAWAVPNYSSGDITGITAGNGLTGGGTSGTPTLNVGAGTGINVQADDVSIAPAYSPRTATELSSSVDLNDLKFSSTGFYYQTANADTIGNNYPSGEAGSLLVQKSAGSVTQTYITYSSTPKVYVRTFYTSWSAWKRIFTDDYHPNADTLTTARNIALTGDVTGSASFNGSANISITATVADDSHNHTIANVDGLQTALNGKASSSHNHSATEIVTGEMNTARLGSGTATSGYVLKSDGDGTASWQTESGTTYSAGSGLSLSGTTFSHSDTSSQASVNNTGSTYIQDITLDTYGHITGLASSTITNNITGSTFMTAYDPDIGSVLQYGLYGWQTIDVGSQGQVLTVGGSNYNQWSDNNGGWTLIKSGSTTLSSGTTVTNVTLSSAIGDTDVIAFELNTGSVTSYTSQVHIVKIENSSSTSGGILYNQYASSSIIRTGSIRVYRGANTTTLSFSNVYYHSNGSTTETADTVYIGSIWKLNGRVGA